MELMVCNLIVSERSPINHCLSAPTPRITNGIAHTGIPEIVDTVFSWLSNEKLKGKYLSKFCWDQT